MPDSRSAELALFRLLGRVRLVVSGSSVDLGPGKQKCLASVLLLNVGQPVPVGGLIDRVWGDRPPSGPRSVLATYITRLRRVLDNAGVGSAVAFRFADGGYQLDCDPDTIDVHRSRTLARRAVQAAQDGDDLRAVGGLRAALHDWQPVTLAGVPGDWAAGVRAGLSRERLGLVVSIAQAELRLGRPERVVAELRELVDEHPTEEDLAGELIRALVRCGQSVQALRCYERLRQAVADELGTEPSARLRDLHLRILRGEPDPDGPAGREPAEPATAVRGPAPVRVTPAQLPADVYGFAGRDEHLTRLDALLADSPDSAPAVLISAVSGTAGVGKTALAVHWTHRVADRFPDGQLYVNLRGFDAGGQVMTAAEAIRGFLDALGVPPDRIPAGLDAQAGLYRSLLDGKRILILLDNARDADHARPLLPGSPTALAVVTSRNHLTGLVVTHSAHPLALDLLTDTEAHDLLTHRLGRDRTAAEPRAVRDIIDRCARLPLGLAIAAARAATHPTFSLTTLAAELADAGGRLDALSADDPATDVRAVFSCSYATLSPDAARLFRLLGLHPGPDVTAPAAAALAGDRDVPPLLTELAHANLLTEHTPGRYTLHDLLRAYATDLARTSDPDDQRRAATTRLLDYYLRTAYAADRLLRPHRGEPALALSAASADAHPLADRDEATAWMAAEHAVLVAAVHHAARTGFHTHTWQLAWAMDTFFERHRQLRDLAAVWQAAVDAARRLADPHAQAQAHRLLGRAYIDAGRYTDAHTQYRSALDLSTQTADHVGQAISHLDLGYLSHQQGRFDHARDHAQQAYALFRAAGHQRGQAHALNTGGWYHAELGDHARAVADCEQALALYQQVGDREGEAATWDSLGYAHHQGGQHAKAVDCYQHALDLRRALGDRHDVATTLTRLGDTQHAAGDPTAARAAWRRALDILTDLDHPDAADVRAKLHGLGRPATADPGSPAGDPIGSRAPARRS